VRSVTATRKPRRKVTTDLGRSILQRERQRLAREQAALGEALANEAQRARQTADNHRHFNKPEQAAVSRGIVRRVAAVLASENVHPAINTHLSDNKMSAWTDFRQIHVTYRMHEDVRLTAAVLRGLMYHEGGHIRFSVPWDQLQSIVMSERRLNSQPLIQFDAEASNRTLQRAWNALEDQRMETAVVSDSPRKAAYFTPVVLAELAETLDAAAANYPLLIWRRYLPKHIRNGARKLFVTKHGANGEAIALALEATVGRYVLATDAETMVDCVIQMERLLRSIRPLAYDLDSAGHNQQHVKPTPKEGWEDALTIPVDPSMIEDGGNGGEAADDTEPVIDPTDPLVAMQLAMVFSHLFIDPWNLIPVRYVVPGAGQEDESDESDEGESGVPGSLLDDQEQDDESDEDQPGDDDSEWSDDEDDDSDFGAADSEDDEDDDFDGDADDEDDEGMSVPEHPGGSSGTHNNDGSDLTDEDDELTQEDLDEALAAANDDRLGDTALNGDVEAFHDALENQVSDLEPYVGGISSDVVAQAEAEMLAVEIEQAFQEATIDRAPAWVEQQRRGIVNVQRYATRQPGNSEFFKAWVDDDQPGFDIAVSVLLDYSGSMSNSVKGLAQCGYATKLACDKLGIPCTVVLWDTDATCLYDATERAEMLPVVGTAGGTDPSHALADLDNQRYDKAKHIVLIMTDGSWDHAWNDGKSRTLGAYKSEGTKFIGFGYGSDELARNLLSKGCDEAYGIRNLMDIPRQLETTLIALA
jgi:hypothetical protein